VYIAVRSPMLRKEIREAVGTYEEIAKRFSVNKTTVWRIRKGR
jgi:DNA invertase Pin-like site-specific DNA recombinase